VVDPRLTTTLATAGTVNASTALANPYSPMIQMALAGIAAFAGFMAKRKNDLAASNALLLKTTIQGVETANVPAVKQAIQAQATVNGVQGKLDPVVQQVNAGLL
jgi:hypothetical protein